MRDADRGRRGPAASGMSRSGLRVGLSPVSPAGAGPEKPRQATEVVIVLTPGPSLAQTVDRGDQAR